MTASRLRIVALLAVVVPIALTGAASPVSAGFTALALASAAGGAAMLLAGPVFRLILSVLLALLGLCVVLVALNTPDGGTLGVLALIAGILQVLVAVGVGATVRRWPTSTSRYSRSRVEGDRASDWDALSEGDDPTDISVVE
jgi:predicted membrane channel-forming protein YqfA (hemolysin III family)